MSSAWRIAEAERVASDAEQPDELPRLGGDRTLAVFKLSGRIVK
jgi:hypothetical protein